MTYKLHFLTLADEEAIYRLIVQRNRGYYTVARRYEFHVREARAISHE